MSPLYRWLAIGVIAVQFAAVGGCAFGRKPYANDPLIKKNRAVWGDREKARSSADSVGTEPITPPAPKAALIGGRAD